MNPRNAMSYLEYVQAFNEHHTDFRYTTNGPIAKLDGVWYSVNGTRYDIQDVRHALSVEELLNSKVNNDR